MAHPSRLLPAVILLKNVCCQSTHAAQAACSGGSVMTCWGQGTDMIRILQKGDMRVYHSLAISVFVHLEPDIHYKTLACAKVKIKPGVTALS